MALSRYPAKKGTCVDFAALERRISALEASQAASLRFGRVTDIKGGKVRVQFRDGQGMNSFELSTIQKRVLKDQDIEMPDIGEPVACLFSGQGWEQGLVLGAYFNERESDPGQAAHMDYKKYADGTEIWYDREAHKLTAKVRGDAEIECEKTVTAKAKEEILAESDKKIKLKAPEIELAGFLTMTDVNGNPGRGVLHGDFTVRDGGITVPDRDVSAGSVSLRQHRHENSGGQGMGGKPAGG